MPTIGARRNTEHLPQGKIPRPLMPDDKQTHDCNCDSYTAATCRTLKRRYGSRNLQPKRTIGAAESRLVSHVAAGDRRSARTRQRNAEIAYRRSTWRKRASRYFGSMRAYVCVWYGRPLFPVFYSTASRSSPFTCALSQPR